MFYRDNLLDSNRRCDCKFCEYYKKQQLEHENFQISSFFEKRIDRKFEQNQQIQQIQQNSSTREEIFFTQMSTLDYSLQYQLRKRQQQEKFKQRRKKFVENENNFSNNLQQFISLYKTSD
ncbi:unnamed protein product [Rhizophagus irregularis]|uniref:Uncharacterized protein n=1 Tax=Rhizophagus irregularis TaxID=588596 RepID=A0A2N1NJF5_9GLOM|nr:hypothetical protein RhiirC2_847233 [Rhizophagus irregularis]CAB4388685.1 unnamed protein product [Rhizophagus irregularis]CAB5369293.1 unnamed protein product [Rhizophagus irregularis]